MLVGQPHRQHAHQPVLGQRLGTGGACGGHSRLGQVFPRGDLPQQVSQLSEARVTALRDSPGAVLWVVIQLLKSEEHAQRVELLCIPQD